MAFPPKGKPVKAAGGTAAKKPPFMGKETKKEEMMETKMPAFKRGGKVKKGC